MNAEDSISEAPITPTLHGSKVATFETDLEGNVITVSNSTVDWLPFITKGSQWIDFLPLEFRAIEKDVLDEARASGSHGPSRKQLLNPTENADGRILIQHSILAIKNKSTFWHLIVEVSTVVESQDVVDYETKVRAVCHFHALGHQKGVNALDDILSSTTLLLGQDIGIISNISGDDYYVKRVYAPGKPLKEGARFNMGETYCEITRSGTADVLVIEHMASSMYCTHPCYKAFGLESYIGTNLEVNKRRIGTINFTSANTRSFSASDVDLVRLVGQCVSIILERAEATAIIAYERGVKNALLHNTLPPVIVAKLAERATEKQRPDSSLFEDQKPDEKDFANYFEQLLSASEAADDDKGQKFTLADEFQNVSIVFADLVGFTQYAGQNSPLQVVSLLNRVYSAMDKLLDKRGLVKIKTIGDCYMAMGGGLSSTINDSDSAPIDSATAARDTLLFGFDVIEMMKRFDMKVRVGIASGPIVAGIVGSRRFQYDVWGDAVNIASRMESAGCPGRVHVAESTKTLCETLSQSGNIAFESRGNVDIKGKGSLSTYFATLTCPSE